MFKSTFAYLEIAAHVLNEDDGLVPFPESLLEIETWPPTFILATLHVER